MADTKNLTKKLTDASQVIKKVEKLFNSRPMRAYESARPVYRAATLMRLPSDVPEDFGQGVTGEIPSTRVYRTSRAMKSKAAGYPRYTDVIAHAVKSGVPTQALVDQADRLGRALTMALALADEGLKITNPTRDHQFVDGYAAWRIVQRRQPDGSPGLCVEVYDPSACAFPELAGGTFRPKRFAWRHYVQTGALKETYGSRGTLSVDAGKVGWEEIATPRTREEGRATDGTGSGSSGSGADAEDDKERLVYGYDDGCWIYQVVADDDSKDGKIVYCERNTVNDEGERAAAAVVIPGDTFSPGSDGEKMLPVLWALLNLVNSINLVNSVRISTAFRARPGTQIVIADKTPEEIEKLQKLQAIHPVESAEGTDALVYTAGQRVQPWAVVANEDLDKIIAQLTVEIDACVGELLVNTNPDVVAQASATAFHISTSETEQQQTSWLQFLDFAWIEYAKMFCNWLANNDESYNLVATDKLLRSGGDEIDQGEFMTLGPNDVNFAKSITVGTRQETEDQKNKRFINTAYKVTLGIATQIDLIEADTNDVTAQVKKLRQDYAMRIAEPVLVNYYFPNMVEDAIKVGAGVWLPVSKQPELFSGQPPAPNAPAVQPTQSFAPAPTEPAAGAAVGGM